MGALRFVRSRRRCPRRRSIPMAGQDSVPNIPSFFYAFHLFLSFWCLLWPALESLTPDLTFAYGTEDARVRSLHRVFQSIELGLVTEEDIYRRFPVLRFSAHLRRANISNPGCREMGLSWTTQPYDYSCHIHVYREMAASRTFLPSYANTDLGRGGAQVYA